MAKDTTWNQRLFVCLVFAFVIPSVESDRVMILSMPLKSHVMEGVSLTQGLPARGHDVYMAVNSVAKPYLAGVVKNRPVKMVTYTGTMKEYFSEHKELKEILSRSILDKASSSDNRLKMAILMEYFNQDCADMMEDNDFIASVKKLNIDLFVLDDFVLAHCNYILPYVLDIPFVSVTSAYEPWAWRVGALPSAVPVQFSSFTEVMGLKDRILNAFYFFTFHLFQIDSNYTLINKYAANKELKTWDDIVRLSELIFVNIDPVLNYAVPLTPNMIDVGGLTTGPPNKLSGTLNDFMEKDKHGVIVVSFGSLVTNIPDEVVMKMAKAFSQVKESVVWQMSTKPNFPVPDNVMNMEWLPQNDILGHPKTKLFVTHSGNNGQYEALYNAVPLLCVALQAEQPYNAARVEHKGFGKQMDIKTFTSEEMLSLIREVIDNESYSHTIKKASMIYRAKPQTSNEKATFWLEYALKYGGVYLKPHALKLPLYQYFMVDLFAIFLLSTVVTAAFFVFCIRFCYRQFAQRKEKLH